MSEGGSFERKNQSSLKNTKLTAKTKKRNTPKEKKSFVEMLKTLKTIPIEKQKQGAIKELARLKLEIFGDKNFNTDKFRKEHKDEVFSTKWIIKQLQVNKLIKLQKRLYKVLALKK